MKNKFAAIVLLVCVATSANGGIFSNKEKKEVDFDGLDKFLVRKEAKADPETNVALIRDNMNKFKGPIKSAAQIVLDVANAAGECTNNLMSHLVKLHDADLRTGGKKRVEIVMRSYLIKVAELCTAHIDQEVEKRYQEMSSSSPDSLFMFLQVVSPAHRLGSEIIRDVPIDIIHHIVLRSTMNFFKDHQVIHFLKYLAKEDPTAQPLKENLQSALDKHIKKPCQQYISKFADLFEPAKAIPNIRNMEYRYVEKRTPNFRCLLWSYKFCTIITGLDAEYMSAWVNGPLKRGL